MPISFAHRGARLEAPENSLEAFRIALAHGATGLESDAHLSADDEVVLTHDRSIRRGVRRIKVARAAADDLSALGAPRLADLYRTLGTDYELSLDLKAPGVGQAVLEVAAEADALHRLWLCAPDLETILALRSGAAGAHLVHSTRKRAIHGSIERHAAELAEARIDAINMHHSDWSPGLVALFHRFEVAAFAWDVQELRHLRAMLAARVDALYSDRVQLMVAAVRLLGSA